MAATRIAMVGAAGRMGQAIMRLASQATDVEIVAAVVIPDDPHHGQPISVFPGVTGDVVLNSTIDAKPDVLIDFTLPAGAAQWSTWCAEQGVAFVSGVTGLSDEVLAKLDAAAQKVPVVWAPNMSVGVNLLLRATRLVADTLRAGWDVEIVEAHHRRKVDAPSGTARALYEAVCETQGRDPEKTIVPGRVGETGARTDSEIGVHAVRMGSVVGDHQVHFASEQEIVTLSHRAQSRDAFAAGALRAAQWAAMQPPGRYDMQAVLFKEE